MATDFEKYLDARFSNIDDKLSTYLTGIDQRFGRMEEDIRDIRGEVRGLKYWFIGGLLTVIAIFIALFTYHAQVMQSQMQVFADYVKAVTQPVVPKGQPPAK